MQMRKKLKELRKKYGMSQEELAEVFGIHQSGISRIESGEQALKLSQIEKFCKYSGEGPDFFFDSPKKVIRRRRKAK